MTEAHRRYWLVKFGAELDGRTATEYVQDEGLPVELRALLKDLEDVLVEVLA